MSVARRSRRGFSLTEILMAVGILGIGMTMVASIFPVAVDQTRRANDTTMAALCARSVAATIRANRASFIDKHHYYFMGMMKGTDTDKEKPAEFGLLKVTASSGNPGLAAGTADTVISKNMRVYNPNLFVYEAGKRYETEKPPTDYFWPMWNAGNYVPIIYVTPIVPTDKRFDFSVASGSPGAGAYNVDGGPWRVTIVVFKSRGDEKLHLRTNSWYQNVTNSTASFVAGAGDYILDRGRHAGECYLIDFANVDKAKTAGGVIGDNVNPPVLLACGISAEADVYAPTSLNVSGNVAWYPLPGAVGAFHTIIGD